jgi:hypothetical protein
VHAIVWCSIHCSFDHVGVCMERATKRDVHILYRSVTLHVQPKDVAVAACSEEGRREIINYRLLARYTHFHSVRSAGCNHVENWPQGARGSPYKSATTTTNRQRRRSTTYYGAQRMNPTQPRPSGALLHHRGTAPVVRRSSPIHVSAVNGHIPYQRRMKITGVYSRSRSE